MEHPGGTSSFVGIREEEDMEGEREQTPDPPCFEDRWKSLAELRVEAHQKMLALEKTLKAEYSALLKKKEVELTNKTKEAQILRKELEKKTKEKGNLQTEVGERNLLLVVAKGEIQGLRDKLAAQQKEIEDLKAKEEETYQASANFAKKMNDEWQNMLNKMSGSQPSTSAGIGREVPPIPGGEDVPMGNLDVDGRTWVEGMDGGQNYSMSLPIPAAASCPGSPASEVDTEVVSISTTPRLTRSSGVATRSISSIAVDVITNKRRLLSNDGGRSSGVHDTQIIILDEEGQVPVAPSTSTPNKYGLRIRKQRKSYASVYH